MSIADTVVSGSLLVAAPLAFAAGVVSFLSPCVLPLVPGYLSYVTGLSGAELAGEPDAAAARRRRTADGDVLYASGHPGPNTPAELGEHNLGLIRSTDAGTTWEPVAFTGQEDFHVLTAGDGAIHGIGSSSITIRTSTDGGTTWIDGAELPAADLTVTTDGTLYAATRQGLQESRDAGATFDLVADAPPLYLVEADSTGGLVGVDTDGTLWRVTGTGSWDSVGAATGTVQALGNADGAVVLVDDRGIVWIHGTETTVVLPAGTAQ